MLPYTLMNILSIALSLMGITFIVVFHEFGHFIFCKLFKVYTPTFSIGIGKILYSKKIGQTDFCLSAGPIGGYVEIATDEGIPGTKGFNQIPYYQKVLIMLGGIACNFILAFFIFTLLFKVGMPESGALPYEVNQPIIEEIALDSVNSHFLKKGDVITTINNKPLHNDARILREEIKELQRLNPHQKELQAEVTIERSGQLEKMLININLSHSPTSLEKKLAVTLQKKAPLSLKESINQAYKTTNFCIHAIIESLKGIFSNKSSNFVGPLMAVAVSSKSAQKGLKHLLFLLAIISINLGFMNLLPLPIFDGGQFVIFTIEAILARQLSEKVRDRIGMTSWIFALSLLVLFTLKDLYSLIF